MKTGNNIKSFYVLLALIAISGLFLSPVFADVVSPKKQMKLNIEAKQIVCKQNLVKLTKVSTGMIACVKPTTAEKLVKAGWALPVDPKIIELVQNRLKQSAAGTVKTIAVTKVAGDEGRLQTTPRVVAYNYIFEACSSEKLIRAPTVVVTSDSETKTVKLANDLEANKCTTSATKIKAASKDSITATLVNKGGVTKKLNDLGDKITDLQEKLAAEKKILAPSARGQEKPDNYAQMVGEATTKIVELRKELNMAKEEFHRYFFSLYVTLQKFDTKQTLSFGGTPIEGSIVNKLSVTQQLASTEQPYGYNVVFEVCAGPQIIRAPAVVVTSDIESTSVKMADRVIPNSCQLGTGKLKAENKDSITVSLANSGDATKIITELENRIVELQTSIAKDKQALEELTKVAQKPMDYEQKVSELTNSIISKRDEINNTRALLHSLLYKFYGTQVISMN